jgi:hypothetical protein
MGLVQALRFAKMVHRKNSQNKRTSEQFADEGYDKQRRATATCDESYWQLIKTTILTSHFFSHVADLT